jgi:hypothetical protein
MQEEAKIGGRYEHKNTGRIYVVLNNALSAWDAYQNLVVYQREDKDVSDQVWVRSLTEFNEKFKLLD